MHFNVRIIKFFYGRNHIPGILCSGSLIGRMHGKLCKTDIHRMQGNVGV